MILKMKKLSMFKKCLLMDARNPLIRKFPFAEYVMVKDPYNQVAFEVQKGIDQRVIRLDGWIYTDENKLMNIFDAIGKFAEQNNCSNICYIDRINTRDKKIFKKYGFVVKEQFFRNTNMILEL